MNWLAAALLIAVTAPLPVVISGGLNARAAFALASVTGCILFVAYLSSRIDRPASRTESVIAAGWLFFRRLVGFLGAASFLSFEVVVGFGMTTALENVSLILRGPLALLLAVVGCFCAWVGVFGQGADRNSFKDDMALHLANKRRYKWRW